MFWRLTSRPAVVLFPLALIVLSVLTVSVLYSQTPGVTVVPVGTEPRGLAYNLATSRAVVTNHNTNTVTVANLTTLTTTTVTVGSNPWGVAINPATNKAYVANEGSDTVSVLNLSTNTVTATIPVGENPKEIAINSSTNTGVVANTKSDTVSILNLATNTVSQTIAVGVDPQGVVVNASTNRAYVSNAGSDTVSVLNLATQTVTATIAVGNGPAGIDLNPGTQRLVVANRMAGTVTILNTSNNAVVATVTVGEGPSDVAINTSTNRAYVSNTFSDSVSVINLSTNAVIATYPVGRNPDGIAVIPAYNVLLVVNAQGDTVYVIDLNNPPSGSPVPVGRDPEGVAIDLDTNTAVTANAKSNDLSVVDLATATELTRIAVGHTPRDVAIHPDSHLVVATNFRANTASIIDLPTRTVAATVPVGRRPLGVAVDPILNLAAVANERDSTLSLIDLTTRAVTATLPAGSHPTDVAIHPTTHVAVVANKKIDKVTLIDLVNRVTIATVTVGKDPVSVAINPMTNTAVVANEKAGTLSVLTLSPAAVTATIPVLARPTGVAINPSTNVAAVVGHETNTLMLVDLATNTVQTTLPAGREPQQVAINPWTNIATVTNEEPPTLGIIQLPNPVPLLTSLVPVAVTAGDPGFTLTLNGSKFVTTSTVTFGGQTYPVQLVSNEQVQANIPASAITAAGSLSVTVTNPSPGGGTSNSLTFTTNNPVPVILTLTPASVTAGDPAFTLTVDGTGFVATSSVQFNGQALTTTFVSATQLTAVVPAEAVGLAGTREVTVANPAPGGGTSNAVTFTVNNPVPTTTSITPTAVIAGAPDTTVTVNGANFVGTSEIQINGASLSALVVSATQLQATIPAARLASAGVLSVTVANPAPGGGVSNAQSFTVNNPVPTLTTLSPPTVDVGSPGVTLTLSGSNFVSTSTASVGGTSVPTTVVSATQFTASVPASLLTTAGALLVTVTNPAPGGGTSNTLVFTVTNPVPSITAISPTLVVTGSGDFTLSVTGTGFVSTSSIVVDGQPLTTTYTSATELTAVVPASAIATSHTAQVTVVNPTPGGGTSNAVPLVVNARPVAHGGRDRSVTVGQATTLDGRQSSDPDGDRLTFAWSLVSAPPGSVAILANSTSVQPSLTADVVGTYQVQLIVNDGKADSLPVVALVTAVAGNAPPNAEAGADQTILVGQAVTLDGRRSGDPDGDRLTYQWSLVSAPTSSAATLSDATEVIAGLTPDVAGDYVVQLLVSDGTAASAPGRITITAASPNAAPMAKAGRDRNVLTGSAVSLDGGASLDPNGDALTYRWTIVSAPSSSAAVLANATTAAPSFTPDVSGEYLIRLVVNDGAADSAPDTILIRADAPNPGPNAVAGSDQLVYQTDTVTLDGTGSSDPNNDPLAYQWLIVSTPANSQAALSGATAAQPAFLADQDGLYVVRLTVSDGVSTSSADVVVVKTRALLAIAVTPANPSIIQGQTQAFTATGTFEDQTTRTLTTVVTWSSSNESVATINAAGVATGLVSGTTQIIAAYGTITSPAQTLTVINPTPTITSVTPTSGPIGTVVTITGTNFNTFTPGDNQLRFNGTRAILSTVTATSITTTVPLGATTGPITLTNSAGTATGPEAFTVVAREDFVLTAAPATASAVQGKATTYQIGVTSTGLEPLTMLITPTVSGLPPGVTATFSPKSLSMAQGTTLTVQTTSATPAGRVTLTVAGSAPLEGGTVTRSATIQLSVVAAGGTTLSGRILDANEDSPIVGATITLGSTTATTDESGNFTLSSPPIGSQVLMVDGPDATYPRAVPVAVTIASGSANDLPYPIYLPKVSQRFTLIDPTRETIVTDPTIPDFEMHIPAGAQIIGWDGQPNTKVSVTQVPIDRLLVKPIPSHLYTKSAYVFSFGKPGGGYPNRPIPVIYPNDLGAPPGARMELWYYDEEPVPDPNSHQWKMYGRGTVTQDGKQVVPDPGVGMPKFCCGITLTAWPDFPRDNPCPEGGCVPVADPVDPSTGLFVMTKTDFTLPGRLPIAIRRTYRTNDISVGPFGTGSSFNYNVFIRPAGTQARDYVLADGGRYTLSQQPDGSFMNERYPFLAGVRLSVFSDGTSKLRFKDGRTLLFNADGGLIEEQDRNGNTVTITRDAINNVQEIRDASGRTFTFTYQSMVVQRPVTNGQEYLPTSVTVITSITDPIGRVVQYAYDTEANLTSVTDPAGGVTRYTYDTNFRMTSITDPRGILYLQNEYDANGRVSRQIQADGGVFTFEYALGGRTVAQTTVIDPRGNPTVYRFNSRGYLMRTMDALGQMTRYERDYVTNQLTAVIDPLNRVTRYTYDGAGNVTSIVDPAGAVALTEYDPLFSRPVKLTNALGHVTKFEYDARGNLAKTTDPLGHSTTIVSDAFGQPVRVTDALGNSRTFEYNREGDLVAIADPLGERSTRAYDTVSRLTAVTDPRGKTTQYQYDALNRVTDITDAIGGVTHFTYDPNGNLLTVTDAKHQTTTYTYDSMDRVETRTDALNRSERYAYDRNGNLTTFTDRKGQVATFQYDGLNRRVQADYADGSRSDFVYDADGRLVRASDTTSGAIEMAYDALNRLTQELTPQGVITYRYDALGRRTTMTVNGQAPVSYGYDLANRLTSVAQGPQTVSLSYDAVGRRTTLTYPNGTSTVYSYDAASRLAGILHQVGTTPIDGVSYTYDVAGNRISLTRFGQPATLLPAEVQAAYNAANQQTQVNSGTPNLTFDANGSLVSQAEAGGMTSYAWDTRNQLVGLSGPGVSASFEYDALGRRVSKTVNGLTTQFQYDGQDVVAEVNSAAVGATYLRSLNIDDPLARQGSSTEYYHADALGSILRLTDAVGATATAYAYEAFGKTTVTGTSANPFQYTGRENDGTGLYYYRARYYSPTLQRFISQDPSGGPIRPPLFIGGVPLITAKSCNPIVITDPNRIQYLYVGNNPLRLNDPIGLGGTQACDYYDQQCDRSTRKGSPDQYACQAGQCCRDFGDGPNINCIRDCLINLDHICTKSATLSQICREISHFYCYNQCGAPEKWPPPSSCQGLFGGMLAPFVRTRKSNGRRVTFYLLFLAAATTILLGIHQLVTFLNAMIEAPGSSHVDFSNPYVVIRSLLSMIGSLFYLPVMFWLLIWIRQRCTDTDHFTQQDMGWLTVIAGTFSLSFSQGPAFFAPRWLQGEWASVYHTLYGMGWCLLLSGILCFPRNRTILLKWHLGIVTLLVSLGWWFVALWQPTIGSASMVWPILYILSSTVALLGILGSKGIERLMAFVGLLLITAYLFAGKPGWLTVSVLLDPRIRAPLDFVMALAWLAVIGWRTGLFERFGTSLER